MSIKTKVFAVAAVAVIGVLVAVIFHLLNQPEPERPTVGGQGTIVTEDNLDELNQPVPDGHYNVHMNTDWVFPSGREESGNAFVENKANNTHTVFFEVVLSDTDELVYTSPYMPLDSSLTGFALDKELEAGEYPAVVTYFLVNDDYEVVNSLSVGVRLIIQS
jgi:hypothetical protein